MRKNKIISFAILLSIIFLGNCERKFGVTPKMYFYEGKPCEKDGIITIHTRVYHNGSFIMVDSLNISENDNRIDINNSVPFSLPATKSYTFFFQGQYQGVVPHVVIWYQYYRKMKENVYQRVREIKYLKNNSGCGAIGSSDYQSLILDSLRGVLFCLDSDTDNSGTGTVTIKAGDYSKIVTIDASKNTVNYQMNARQVEFVVETTGNSLGVSSSDYNSFVDLGDGAIWFLRDAVNPHILDIGLAESAYSLSPDSDERTLIIRGFAPNYIFEKEMSNAKF